MEPATKTRLSTEIELGLASQKPVPAPPSCAFMKTDAKEYAIHSEPGLKSGRPPSPVASCVSMESAHSTGDRPNMAGESVPSDPRLKSGRPPSPVPSCVSMKIDHSTGDRPNMAGESVPSGPSGLTQTQSPHENTTSSGGVQLHEDPISLTSGQQNHHKGITNPACQQPHIQLISMTKDEDLLNAIKSHKATMKRRFEEVNEGQVEGKDKVLLNKIYTELYITEGQSEDVNQEHEVRQLAKSHQRQRHDTSISVNEIFKSSDGQRRQIKTVMTTGIAGIGKTVSVQKFILDWADGKANQDIDFIFVLPFRELNMVRNKKCAFHGVLKDFYPELEDPHIYDNCTVLFVFDGLDESRLEVDFSCCDEEPFDMSTKAPVGKLIENLIRGKLLPSALVWITSRPAAARQIPAKCINQMTEIRGFNDAQKEEYFKKRIPDPNQARSILTHIWTTKSLFIMCHIPVFCGIAATVLQDLLRRGVEEIPKTMTEMFSHFLLIMTNVQRQKYPPESQGTQSDPQDIIVKLAHLAFTQLMKGNILFYEKDLEECGIEVREASVYSGICTEIFKEELVINQEKLYSFVHLSIQEFLAAYFVFHSFANQEKSEDEESSDDEENSEEEETQQDEDSEDEEDPDDIDTVDAEDGEDLWSIMMEDELDEDLAKDSGDNDGSKPEDEGSENDDISGENQMQKESFNLVANDNIPVNREKLVERQTSNSGKTEGDLNDDGSTENVVKLKGEKMLNLQPTTQDKGALDEETHEAEDMHAPEDEEPSKDVEPFEDEDMFENEDLFEDEDEIEDEDALEEESIVENPDDIFPMLKSVVKESLHCKNGKIDLFVRFLMGLSLESNQKLLEGLLGQTVCSSESIEKTIQYIKKTLSRQHKSTERCVNLLLCLLEMKDNSLQKDMEQYLRSGEKLSPEQCSTLAYILLASDDIQDEFDLTKYNTTRKGRDRLVTAVRGCRKAKLSGCLLSKHGFQSLTLALKKNSYLKELDLSYSLSHVEDCQSEFLEGLALGDCKVETLRLVSSGITEDSCDGLLLLLLSEKTCLRHLDLSCNSLASAIMPLFLAMALKNCKLEILRLASCGLTRRSCEIIKSSLQSNNSFLKELDLSFNNLLDSGVMTLFDGLDHQNCKLKTLRLVCCNITGGSCGKFASALVSRHSQLRDLDLTYNDLKDSGVKMLSTALGHCKLETLRLSGCCISDEGCEALASALTSPSSTLMELDLSYNHPGQRSMDLLKQCKLNKLSFDNNGPDMLNTGPQIYACELTLDPNTAHVGLSLSEGNRKVTVVKKKMPYPDHPERFQYVPQVLCAEGLCGRCYWEVHLSDFERTEEVGGAIGVAYKCLPRIGRTSGSMIGGNNMSWSLLIRADNEDTTDVMFNCFIVPAKSIPAKRLGVFLDWPAGTLSFFSISPDKHTHLHTFCTNFTEPVYPGFMFGVPNLSFTLAERGLVLLN